MTSKNSFRKAVGKKKKQKQKQKKKTEKTGK